MAASACPAGAAPKRACVLGLGTMGTAISRRLLECGYSLSAWNRSPGKASQLVEESRPGTCTASPSPAAALLRGGHPAPALLMLTDTAAVLSVLREQGVGAALRGRILVNLTSGNPDEGREIAKVADEVSGGEARLIDGAYCGAPSKARAGEGQLFLSSAHPEAVDVARPLLSSLGSVTFCGAIGSSRAMDYAVVDLFFMNLLSFMSNRATLEREGVDIKQLCMEMKKRLDSVPAALEMYDKRMATRTEADYNANTTVTLATARSYWASRMPYNQAHGIPSHVPHFYLTLLDSAAGGEGGPHAGADLSRLQEVVRYGVEPCGEGPQAKKART